MLTNTTAQPDRAGIAPIIALATAIMLTVATISVMLASPAMLPAWCTLHGCP